MTGSQKQLLLKLKNLEKLKFNNRKYYKTINHTIIDSKGLASS